MTEGAASGESLATAGVAAGVPGAPADAAKPHAHLGRRNDRLLLAGVASYAVLLSVLMISRGISVTPDVVVVSFGLAAMLLGRGRLFLRDWIPFVALFFAYELMRGYADKFGLPIHVSEFVSIDRLIGLGTLPTQILQNAFHVGAANAADPLASIAVVFYILHFPLPLAVGFLLWIHQRRVYYDYVAALILLSMAAFATYLLFPVAPPWWAETHTNSATAMPYASGILHLRDAGFQGLADFFHFGNYFYSYSVYSISSNDVAAFPSLHAAYPFLAFLFARRAFGRTGWLMLAYTACIWFAIVYLGEHWVADIIGGVIYASASYFAVMHGPRWVRRFMEKVADEEIEAGVEAEDEGDAGALRRLGRHVRWALVVQGGVVTVSGVALAFGISTFGWLGGTSGLFYFVAWLAILGGGWRGAAGLLSR